MDENSLDEENDLQNDGLEEESEKNTNDEAEFSSKKKEGRKSVRYSFIDDTVERFRDYLKPRRKRKVSYFKCRRMNIVALNYKKHKPSPKVPKISEELHNAELEMTTISSLREMYFNRPKILQELEEIRTGKEQTFGKLPGIQQSVFKPYLDRYKPKQLDELFVKIPKNRSSVVAENKEKPKIKKSRDAIRNGYVVSVFNVDDDNLFSDKELFRIHGMKRNVCLIKEKSDRKKYMSSSEVWDWDELANNFPNFPEVESTISESSYEAEETYTEPMDKPDPEERMKNYLVNWFRRESPSVESQGTIGEFQFYDNKYPRELEFLTDEDRKNAAIKFLKYAKIVYPDLNCMKVLNELGSYIGPVTLDALQIQTREMGSVLKIPNKKLRYFRKVLKETKELENIFVGSKIKTDVESDSKVKRITPEIQKELEEKFKNTLENNHLSYIYEEYAESCLPSPFSNIFISIANGLMKYNVFICSDPEAKEYKWEMFHLVAAILQLMLRSLKWVIDTIFCSRDRFDFSDVQETEEETCLNDPEEERALKRGKEELDSVTKKLMVHMMKFMNLNYVLEKKDADVSSEESQSISSISMEGEKKTRGKNEKR